MPAVWGDASPRAGDRGSQRQRAGIHVASVLAVRASHGAHPLPHAAAESAVERVAEAFFGRFKRDYVYQACRETLEEVGQQVPGWIDHDNQEAPHSALGMQTSAEC